VLLEFARVAAEAGSRGRVLPLLVDAVTGLVPTEGVAALEVGEGGTAKVVATFGLPSSIVGWTTDADSIGYELGQALSQVCGDGAWESLVRPIIGNGALFGALVLLFTREKQPSAERRELVDGLVDLAATVMSNTTQLEELRRAHEDLRASQAALVKTERLRALGQMSAGIAHDLKNILNPISLHLHVLKRAAARGDVAKTEETIEAVRQVVQRGAETTERLRAFSRQSPEQGDELIDLDRLAHEAAELARPRMTSSVGRMSTIAEEFGSPPRIRGRAGEIVSALLNIIVNSIDAMPQGGRIIVRTEAARGGALVQIVDNGPGMSPDVARHVLEPFFTTKGDAGTGLGLAMVHACVERHQGTLTIDTAPGAGTTMSLWFPAA
jgi:signal transduction histidine kinase